MLVEELSNIIVEQRAIASKKLGRYVILDLYLPKNIPFPSQLNLLLLNDGQNLDEMPFSTIYNGLLGSNQVEPLLCVGIHTNKDRKNEYGTAGVTDYEGRGAKAGAYTEFILEELMPFIHVEYGIKSFKQKAFGGFSLGGLSALDIVWHYPDIFSIAGIFSGSLWWRSKSLEDDYDDLKDKIMHKIIREGNEHPNLRFFFTTGSLDEIADRNNNGIIDSIDDTLDLINELNAKGYNNEHTVKYINYEDGRHDIPTWGRAIPTFLLWAFPKYE